MERKLLSLLAITLFLLSSGCLGRQSEAAASQLAPSQIQETTAQEVAETIVPYTDIMVQDLKDMIDAKDDVLILDVRTEAEFAQGHLIGAVNIPHFQIEERHRELNVDKDKKIAVICAAGVRSRVAAESLSKLGYSNVYNVMGGLDLWYKRFGKYSYG